MYWCYVCGTMTPNAAAYYVVGSAEAVAEEPLCAGWQWRDFMTLLEEPWIIHAAKLVTPDRLPLPPSNEPRFTNLDIGELDTFSVDRDARASLELNNRLEIFNVSISDICNRAITFSNVGLLPGMSLVFRCDQHIPDSVLQLLVRTITPSEAYDYAQKSWQKK